MDRIFLGRYLLDLSWLLFIYGRLCRSEVERQDVEEMVADLKVLRFVCGRLYKSKIEWQVVKRWNFNGVFYGDVEYSLYGKGMGAAARSVDW